MAVLRLLEMLTEESVARLLVADDFPATKAHQAEVQAYSRIREYFTPAPNTQR